MAGASAASPATVALLTVGPVQSRRPLLQTRPTETVASTYLASSEGGNFAAEPEEGEEIELPKEKDVSITPEPAEGEPEEPIFKGPNGGLFSAETKSGTLALDGASNEGVFLSGESGPACFFSGYAVVEE